MEKTTKIKVLTIVLLFVVLSTFAACGHQCLFDKWTTIVEATHTTTGLEQAICSCGETRIKEIPAIEEHAYSAWNLVKERTCTEEGLEERICICGHKDSRVIPAAHDALEESIATEATCEKDGLRAFTCTLCKETIAEEIIPATGHTPKSQWTVVVEANCETAGKEKLCCKNCDAVLESKDISAKGHHYEGKNDGWVFTDDKNCATIDSKTRVCTACGHTETEALPASHKWEIVSVTKPVTCTSDGIEHAVCTLCAAEKDDVVAAAGHNYQWVTTEATCTKDGIKKDTCTGCGDVRATEIIEAKGHNYITVVDVEATCTTAGKQHQECDACGEVLKNSQADIPTVNHDFVDWKIVLEATCTNTGKQERFCRACGKKEETVIEKIDHVYDWAHASEKDVPTCTADGKLSWMCKFCGDIQGYMPDKAVGHDYAKVVTAPTCTEKGFTTYTCKACNDEYVDNWTDPAGHKFGNYTVVKEATCETPGSQTGRCSVCNAQDTKDIAVLAHVYEWKTAIPATCLTSGEEKYVCTCGKITATRVIAATGHKMGDIEVVTAATCTKNGVSVQRCMNEGCKYQVKETIEAAHKWTEAVVVTAATCTKEGKTVHYCTVCKTEEYIVLEKIKHNMAWIEVMLSKDNVWKETKATCTSSGMATYKCTECDYHTDATKLTEKTAHTPAAEWVIDEPTCTENGRKHLHCVDCNAEIKSQTLLATGHINIKWIDNNTTGVSSYTCTCGKVFDKMSIGLVIEGGTLVSVGTCKAKVIYVPATVTKIGAGAFDSCTNLTTVYLPAGLTKIGENAFRDCKALTNIYFDGSNAAWEAIEKGTNWDKNTGEYTVH